MKILKQGKAHKRTVWYATCNFCESELRIIKGDPRSMEVGSCTLRFKCPVCGQLQGVDIYHIIVENDELLTAEDKKEIENWVDDPLEDLNKEELIALNRLEQAINVRMRLGIDWEDLKGRD